MLIVFSAAVFTSAFLLFLIQPMFARAVLPLLGGAPAIWNTALVFYQTALLAGYAYAHISARWLKVRTQFLFHLGLMLSAALMLPIGVPSGWTPPSGANPVPWLLALLAVAVGLPFFVVSATSPLLQRWLAATQHTGAADPYFLYAASNLGSMLSLLSYPVLVEPALELQQQSRLWAAGYGAVIVLMTACIVFLWRSTGRESSRVDPGSSETPEKLEAAGSGSVNQSVSGLLASHLRLRWIMLAFVPSSLMMSVTNYLTADIAAVPLLWVIPLSLYLLSFILVFARRPPLPHSWMVRLMPFLLLPLVVVLAIHAADPIAFVLPLHLAAFFVVAMVCHGELARSRPPARDLTQFYLYLSAGGVLGGACNALLAPLLFSGIAEYPIVLMLACLFLPWPGPEGWRSLPRQLDVGLPALLGLLTVLLVLRVQEVNPSPGVAAASVIFGLPALVSLAFRRRPLRLSLSVGALFVAALFLSSDEGHVLLATRSFFGVTKVSRDYSGQFTQILHGSTLHGSQAVQTSLRRNPLSYYERAGPLGQFFEACDRSKIVKDVAVVGLGAGTICCYARRGQRWTYFEIDPEVARVAEDARFFTYLEDCPADVSVVMGDGRLSIARSPDGAYDVLILDAYNSDSVPVHLLTREALRLYFRKLAPHGIAVFHITNRYLDLEPVLGNLAAEQGHYCLAETDGGSISPGAAIGRKTSQYVVMARTSADLTFLASDGRWSLARKREDVGNWTDSYSSILKLLKWRR